MKKIINVVFINICSLAMQSNINHKTEIVLVAAVNHTNSMLQDNNDSGVTYLLDVIEDTRPPYRHKNSEKIELLDKKIAQTTNMMINGVKQPFKTWFGVLNYLQDTKKDKVYACPLCDKKFGQSITAGTCYLRHYDSGIFTCDRCQSDFESFKSYKKHNNCPDSKSDFEQPVTANVLLPKVADEVFLKEFINKKIMKIECCDTSLGNWATALNHTSKRHKIGRYYQCNRCFKNHKANEKALECYVNHNDASIFTCPVCDYCSASRTGLLNHDCKANTHTTNTSAGCVIPSTADSGNSHYMNYVHAFEANSPIFVEAPQSYQENSNNNLWTSYPDFYSHSQQVYNSLAPNQPQDSNNDLPNLPLLHVVDEPYYVTQPIRAGVTDTYQTQKNLANAAAIHQKLKNYFNPPKQDQKDNHATDQDQTFKWIENSVNECHQINKK